MLDVIFETFFFSSVCVFEYFGISIEDTYLDSELDVMAIYG